MDKTQAQIFDFLSEIARHEMTSLFTQIKRDEKKVKTTRGRKQA